MTAMFARAPWRLHFFALGAILIPLLASCTTPGGSGSGPSPVPKTETFTGTLQPAGLDSKTFTVTFTAAATELSATVNSLTTVAGSTPVTGITIGVGFGVPTGVACAVQIQTPSATLGQELAVPGGVNSGTYCVQISDCPPSASTTGCSSKLTEPVTYSMTVKHF